MIILPIAVLYLINLSLMDDREKLIDPLLELHRRKDCR